MQHAQLINGIKTVTEALELSGLRDALAPSNSEDTELLLASLRKYAIAASGYSSAEVTVADLLGLAELDSSTVWAKMLGGVGAREHYHDRVAFVTHHLPRFVEVLEESSETPPSGDNTICVTVVGSDRGLSTTRLVTIVNSVSGLYRASADLNGLKVADLMLVSVDSSDDDLLWFEGNVEAVNWVKELLTSAFRWLALYREEGELEDRITAAKANLPTIQTINELAKRGNISADEASEMEHQVLLGLLAFFDAGALIPEMAEDLQQDPREIVNSSRPSDVANLGSGRALDAVLSEIEGMPDEPESLVGEEAIIELEPSAVEISDETL
jgi:hypothetical protein